MKSTFKVLFYLKKGSEKKNGEVMIMARITIDGKLCQFSTKQSILPDSWNIAAGKAKGKDAGKINALLDDIKASLNNIYHEQQRRDNYVTAEKVKNEFLGHSEKHETVLTLFKKHNDDVKQLVGISKTIATYRKYEVTRRHLAEFIQSKYNVSDFAINEITPMFYPNFFLFTDMCILRCIADGKKTSKLVFFGSINEVFYIFRFVTDGNTERTRQSLCGCCQ